MSGKGTFFARSVLITELLPTLGYPASRTRPGPVRLGPHRWTARCICTAASVSEPRAVSGDRARRGPITDEADGDLLLVGVEPRELPQQLDERALACSDERRTVPAWLS